MKELTIRRDTADLFSIKSSEPYWSDGAPINATVAWDAYGIQIRLSSMRAQAIARANGIHCIEVSPIAIAHAAVLAAAKALRVGESEVVTLS